MSDNPVIVALDFPAAEPALALAGRLSPELCRLKVGKELFTRCGPGLVESLHGMGFDVFLDLKFHDIPNTVAGAIRAAAELGVWMVNVHASGGAEMMQTTQAALKAKGGHQPLLIAVTVLTSLDRGDLDDLGYEPVPIATAVDVDQEVDRLRQLMVGGVDRDLLRPGSEEQRQLLQPTERVVGVDGRD